MTGRSLEAEVSQACLWAWDVEAGEQEHPVHPGRPSEGTDLKSFTLHIYQTRKALPVRQAVL